MVHVSQHHVQTKLRHHLAQLLKAFFVGGNLRLQVGQVLHRVAAGVRPALQQGQHLSLAQHTAINQLDIVDLHAFFFNRGRKRRHGAWRDTADVGMVAARANIKSRLGIAVTQVHRRDDGDVRQMGAAVVRIVEHEHIARVHVTRVVADHRLNAFAHRP